MMGINFFSIKSLWHVEGTFLRSLIGSLILFGLTVNFNTTTKTLAVKEIPIGDSQEGGTLKVPVWSGLGP